MASIKFSMIGFEQFRLSLENLPSKVSKRVLRKALRAGAKPIAAAAKNLAPSKSGALRSSIKVRSGKRSRRGMSIIVGLGADWYKGDQFYAAFVEFGYRVGSRKLGDARREVEGQHFMKRAADNSTAAATSAAIKVMSDQIAIEAKRN